MSPRARSVLRAAILTLVLVPFLAGAAGGGASGASVLPGAQTDRVTTGPAVAQRAAPGWEQGKIDPRHPYSDPIYYPLRQYMRMDCFKGNPGCPGYHKVWTLTLSTAALTGPGDNAIVAMGAGRYQFVRKGPECGRGGAQANFGTEVLIDHGGGVVTRYGHLSNRDLARYRAKDGRLVAAGERIGTMGLTGARNCGKPYVNFHIERQGVLTRFDNLTACLDGARQQWPRDQFARSPRYPTWNSVREDDSMPDKPYTNRSFFPRMVGDETPANLEPDNAPDNTCLPTAAPATPNRPVKPAVAQAGKGKLRVTWRGQPARTYAVARVLFLRRSDNTWRLATTRVARRGTQAVLIGGLRSGVRHRVTLSYRNGVGFSAYSPASDRFTT